MTEIIRARAVYGVSLSSSALTAAVSLGGFAGGGYALAGTWAGGAKMAFQASLDGVTWFTLEDEYGSRIEHTIAASPSAAKALPSELFAFPYVRFWSEVAGVNQNQTININVVLQG